MPTGAFSAQGSVITINGIEIGEVVEFGGPETERPQVDATHLRSTSREYIGGLKDNGEFTLTVNYLPADPGQLELRRCQSLEGTQTFVVTLPNDANGTPRETWTFQATVNGSSPSGSVDEVLRREWTMAVSGDIAYAV